MRSLVVRLPRDDNKTLKYAYLHFPRQVPTLSRRSFNGRARHDESVRERHDCDLRREATKECGCAVHCRTASRND